MRQASVTIQPMNAKPRPNHRQYLRVLRGMTPAQRLQKAFALSETARALFLQGLRQRFPDRPAEQINKLYVDRLAKCHNRNY